MALVIGLVVAFFGFQVYRAQSAARAAEQARKVAAERAAAKSKDFIDVRQVELKVTKAIAIVHPLGDSKVSGKVTFSQQDGGVEIVGEFTGLSPGEHGFHVHEFGDCSMADGKCAGGHFNPTKQPHAGPDDAHRHVGDLGNIKADAGGKATYKRVDKMISLNGMNSIIGRSVIVHANPDDFKTQDPPGNAGARIGCGVIGIADPKMAH
jgi:Cu-Zn family superoxide dismutase